MLFQYQAGPRWSYFEISSIENGLDGANCGGSWIVGVNGSSGTVRSTTRMPPLTIPAARSASSAELLLMALYLSSDAELRTQLAQRLDEHVHVLVVVVEMEADAQVVIAIGRDDVAPHQLLRQRAARFRRHADHRAAPLVLPWRNARPVDLAQLLH